jgi:hypothetical protein
MDYLLFFVRVVSSLVGHFGLNSRVSQYNKLSTSDETFYCTKCIDRLPCFTDSFFHNISIRSSDTEFSNTGSSECGTYQLLIFKYAIRNLLGFLRLKFFSSSKMSLLHSDSISSTVFTFCWYVPHPNFRCC